MTDNEKCMAQLRQCDVTCEEHNGYSVSKNS